MDPQCQTLVRELVQRWETRLQPLAWPDRVGLLRDIHDTLAHDLKSKQALEEVFGHLVAELAERLGKTPVTCTAQAAVLATSADPHHRDLAATWRTIGAGKGQQCQERRREPRIILNAPAKIHVDETWVPCRIIDVSTGGALIDMTVMVPIGRDLCLTVPERGPTQATVVRRAGGNRYGIAFATSPTAAPIASIH